jgi:DNA repair exonuclease SbcCD nuclease subunit
MQRILDGMNKVALISDIHFGVRRNNEIFLESQMKFFKNQFIPTLIKENIKDIFILGDTMDNRNAINVKVLSEVYLLFKNDLKDFNIIMIPGNHDIYLKNSNEINSIEFLEALPNVTVYKKIKLLNHNNKTILLVPWIIDYNEFKKEVANNNLGCDYCFGHFEITGFNMTKTNICENGIDPSFFTTNYNATFSGHFHKRTKKNVKNNFIQYIGSPCQYTRADVNEDRGFVILDVLSGDYKFINNNQSIKFKEIKYPEPFTKKQIQGNLIDVIIEYDNDYNEELVQKYLQIIQKYNPAMPATVKIENKLLDSEIEIKSQSIEELIKEYIESLDIENKQKITNNILNLYKECSRG